MSIRLERVQDQLKQKEQQNEIAEKKRREVESNNFELRKILQEKELEIQRILYEKEREIQGLLQERRWNEMEWEKILQEKEKGIEKENFEVRGIIEKQQKENQELEDTVAVANQIIENAKQMLCDLPQNSPLRKSILFYLSQNLPDDIVVALLGNWSKKTVQRARKERGVALRIVKARSTVFHSKRIQRKKAKQVLDAKEFLLTVLPWASGRNFRIRRKTWQALYDLYKVRQRQFKNYKNI